ncbi:MAG: RHS repeat-associated core domain-containing protein [Nitrospira sp.]|nr:RHS repeat-associated core domain-containing protein [Nitrospira sp.]
MTSMFVYDGDGGRVKKTVQDSTSSYVTRYISKLYECDTWGGSTSCSRFIWANDTRVATVATNGTVHYWHGDHLGSSSVITTNTGAKAQTLTYSPFGGPRTNQSFTTPAVDVPYKYTGKEFDYSTDFYYYESRYYDPWFGRFISPDTLVPNPRDPQDLNRYTYAGNNPLIYTDPTGHFKIKIGKFFKRAFGDVGTTLVGVAVGGFTGCWTCAAAIMSQSESGRYALTGAVLATTTVATFYCGGCGGWATGAAIGAWTGAAVGGYSAHVNGGDLSSGILFGSSIGAITGGITGGVGNAYGLTGAAFHTLSYSEKILVAAGVGGMYGASSGAAQGFAGGKGTIGDILQSAGIGFGIGAVTAAGLQAVAPPLSTLAAKIGNINLATSEGGNYTLKNLYDAIGNIGKIDPSLPNRLAPLTTNIGQLLDVNRALLLGGGAALGTGAAFNYEQVLPFVHEKCAVASPCTPIKRDF